MTSSSSSSAAAVAVTVAPAMEMSMEEYKELQAQVSELSFEDACYELLECSRYGEVDAVRAILEQNPSSVNTTTTTTTTTDGEKSTTTTPLHKACANGHAKVVQLLLGMGNAELVTNESGNTPLHWAAANGHHEVVDLLLKHYTNVDVLQKNSFGRSALTEGFSSKSTETAKLLLEHDSASEEKLLAGAKEVVNEDQKDDDDQKTIIHKFCFGTKQQDDCIVNIQELPIAMNTECNPLGETAIEDTTGLGIWCASLVMAQWMADLASSSQFRDKTIIELGAGCGVPGLTIASSSIAPPKHVYVTDLNPTTVQNLQTNIQLNDNLQHKATAMTMDWNDKSTWPQISSSDDDVVLIGSDLVYQNSIIPLLKGVVLELAPSVFYYVAPDTGRAGLDEFITDMKNDFVLVSKKVAPGSYHNNPLHNQDEEEAFLHFHELTSSTFILYEFRKK